MSMLNIIMFKPTTLYIKTHNKTKLKYFGKTVQDPYSYKGSGTFWLRHLNKHGNDVSTEILGHYVDETECKKVALEFSLKNNIVESKEWANLKPEFGTDGGDLSDTEGYKRWLPILREYKKNCKWWNNGIEQTFSPEPPDSSYIRGRLSFNNIGSKIGASIQKDKVWVNNGITEMMLLPSLIPNGYKMGRLNTKAFAGGTGRHSAKGSHWWNNGVESRMSVEQPGDEWKRGRLIKAIHRHQ
jgi:hypothetical protein